MPNTTQDLALTAERGDAELISAARLGDAEAFGELFQRHQAAVRSVALRHVRNASDADDLTAEAFAKVYEVMQKGGGPDAFFRAYTCTAVSRLAFAQNDKAAKDHLTGEPELFENPGERYVDPVMSKFESGVVATAFTSLPERWQAVLWYSEVDGLMPAQIAPMLGLSANGVSALLIRAREGLRNAYLQGHIRASEDRGCEPVAMLLGAYVRDGLGVRNHQKVQKHLEDCSRCSGLVSHLEDVGSSMRAVVLPLYIGVAASFAPLALAGGTAAGVGAGAAAAGQSGSQLGATAAAASSASGAVHGAAAGAGANGAGALSAGSQGAGFQSAAAQGAVQGGAGAVPPAGRAPWWRAVTQPAGAAAAAAGVVVAAAAGIYGVQLMNAQGPVASAPAASPTSAPASPSVQGVAPSRAASESHAPAASPAPVASSSAPAAPGEPATVQAAAGPSNGAPANGSAQAAAGEGAVQALAPASKPNEADLPYPQMISGPARQETPPVAPAPTFAASLGSGPFAFAPALAHPAAAPAGPVSTGSVPHTSTRPTAIPMPTTTPSPRPSAPSTTPGSTSSPSAPSTPAPRPTPSSTVTPSPSAPAPSSAPTGGTVPTVIPTTSAPVSPSASTPSVPSAPAPTQPAPVATDTSAPVPTQPAPVATDTPAPVPTQPAPVATDTPAPAPTQPAPAATDTPAPVPTQPAPVATDTPAPAPMDTPAGVPMEASGSDEGSAPVPAETPAPAPTQPAPAATDTPAPVPTQPAPAPTDTPAAAPGAPAETAPRTGTSTYAPWWPWYILLSSGAVSPSPSINIAPTMKPWPLSANAGDSGFESSADSTRTRREIRITRWL